MYPRANPVSGCLALALAAAIGLGGCATPVNRAERLARFLSRLDVNPTTTEWVRTRLAGDDEEYLASVTVLSGYDIVRIRKRYVQEGRLICDQARSETMPDWQRLYEVDDADAIAMYRNFFDQAMAGYSCFIERDGRYGADISRDYVIAWGPSCVITANEGGQYNSFVYHLMAVHIASNSGEFDEDVRDYARYMIDRRNVPSFATYVVMALDYFDEACTWHYTGDTRFPEPAAPADE